MIAWQALLLTNIIIKTYPLNNILTLKLWLFKPFSIFLVLSVGLLGYGTANGKNNAPQQLPNHASRLVNEFVDCPQNFTKQAQPKFLDAQLAKDTYPLCFDGFAVMYSGITRSPLWAAEYLTRERLNEAYELERVDNFHPESRLPKVVRTNTYDYSGSGYDRGHLAPNADMATMQQQYNSFSLANIVPQSPYLNREVWRQVESSTRYLTKVYGTVYVVTGTVYEGNTASMIGKNARIMVPTHIYKAIYVPAINQAGVYYAPNDESGRIEVISLDELATKAGVDVMPNIASNVKTDKMQLSLPYQDTYNPPQQEDWWFILAVQIFDWIKQQFNG